MPVANEKEKTAAEKIAQSSGDETEKYAQTLEDGADKLIDQLNKQREEEGKKGQEQIDDLNKNLETEEVAKKAEEEGKKTEEKKTEGEKEEIVGDEIKAEEGDSVESLKDKLEKSEQRIKDTRTDYSKKNQDFINRDEASKAVIENLNETVLNLSKKTDELSKATTVKEEKAAEKAVKKELISLDKQFEAIKNIDPEMAEPIRQMAEGIRDNYTSEITILRNAVTELKTELKNSTESAQKSAQEIADDKHFGAIAAAHKNWETNIVDTPEFEAYVDGLSPRQKVLARADLKTGSAENIIELFDDYKVVAGITKKEEVTNTETNAKTEKLKAAQNLVNPALNKAKNIKTEGVKIKYTRSMIREMMKNPAEFAKHEDDIDKEMAAGRIPDI